MKHESLNRKPNFSISLSMRTYKFVLWAQQRGAFKVGKSAVIEQALIELADRMGFYVETDKAQLAEDMKRLEHTVDVI